MIDEDTDRRLTQMLEDLGPADPPAGFVRQVMERISLEDRQQIRGRIIPFHKGGVAMVRKAVLGLAAAAAVVLAVYTIKGFPPVDRGTEGTIGAAQKYQAPQIGDNDVVLGDAAAQEFLQSEAFDRLLKDPEARSLLADKSVQAQLKNVAFLKAARDPAVRDGLTSQALMKVLANHETRDEFTAQLKATLSQQAVSQASATSIRSAVARDAVAQLMMDLSMKQALANPGVRSALANPDFQSVLMKHDLAAGFLNVNVISALQARGIAAALANGGLSARLSDR